MNDGIYGLTIDVDWTKYSIMWQDKWYTYTLNYKNKTTTFKSDRSFKTIVELDAVVPLNEKNFVETIDRIHKLLLLKK